MNIKTPGWFQNEDKCLNLCLLGFKFENEYFNGHFDRVDVDQSSTYVAISQCSEKMKIDVATAYFLSYSTLNSLQFKKKICIFTPKETGVNIVTIRSMKIFFSLVFYGACGEKIIFGNICQNSRNEDRDPWFVLE